MGYYVNPRNQSKEAFLIGHGVEVPGRTLDWDAVPKGCLPVVLVNNGPFTAAGICYSPAELKEFTRPEDPRSKTIYVVEVKDLLQVAGGDFAQWAKKNGLVKKTV